MTLYEQLAQTLETAIRRGVLRTGERLPSIREASVQHGVSIKTVIRAYSTLEGRGLIESRPQSGYFVRLVDGAGSTRTVDLRPARRGPLMQVSTHVDVSRLVLSTLRSISQHDAVPLGSPYPDPSRLPSEKLNRYAHAIGRSRDAWRVTEGLPPGDPELIRQIARRHVETGLQVDPNEMVITVGATEAINLCLQAVARPGDTVAVESPTFYAMLHAIERLGMKAIEVATHPELGLDVDALEKLVKGQRIAACMVMPNFQNPLGFRMTEERKRQLVAMAARHELPLIENDVYGELYFDRGRPGTLKSLDDRGLVLYCSSFSKSLTAAYRIGWTLPGRWRDQVEKLKFLNTLTTSVIPQRAIAAYLERDSYERHLRGVRRLYAQQAETMRAAVARHFPHDTRTSRPAGGYVLWVELPGDVDSMQLYRAALERGITIGPGRMFSVSNRYARCIRLNFSYPWSADTDRALRTLGKLVKAGAR